MLVDLSTTDLVYPSSCVASSRAFVKAEPKLVEDFLRAYVAGIQLIKKDHSFAEKIVRQMAARKGSWCWCKKTVEAYAKLFKPAPYVPDKGIGKRDEGSGKAGVPCRRNLSAATIYSATTVHWSAPQGNNVGEQVQDSTGLRLSFPLPSPFGRGEG